MCFVLYDRYIWKLFLYVKDKKKKLLKMFLGNTVYLIKHWKEEYSMETKKNIADITGSKKCVCEKQFWI